MPRDLPGRVAGSSEPDEHRSIDDEHGPVKTGATAALRRWVSRIEIAMAVCLAPVAFFIFVCSFVSQDPRDAPTYQSAGAFLAALCASLGFGAWSIRRLDRMAWPAQLLPAAGLAILAWVLL